MRNSQKLLALRMSSNQHTLLHRAIESGGISLEEMLQITQVTAGSLLRHNWFHWDDRANKGEGAFIVTPDGHAAFVSYTNADITRKNAFRPLSSAVRDRSLISQSQKLRESFKEAYDQEQARERKPRNKKKK